MDSRQRLAGKSRRAATLRCLKSIYIDMDSIRERTEERERALKGRREGEEGYGCGVLRREDEGESGGIEGSSRGRERVRLTH